MTPEKIVQNAIIKFIKSLDNRGENIIYERRQAGGGNYKKGMPDLWFVWHGIHIEIEVKKPGGKRSTMQEKYEQKIRDCGAVYILAESVADVIDQLQNQLAHR